MIYMIAIKTSTYIMCPIPHHHANAVQAFQPHLQGHCLLMPIYLCIHNMNFAMSGVQKLIPTSPCKLYCELQAWYFVLDYDAVLAHYIPLSLYMVSSKSMLFFFIMMLTTCDPASFCSVLGISLLLYSISPALWQ